MPIDPYNAETMTKIVNFGYGGITIVVLLGVLRYFWHILEKERNAHIETLEKRSDEIKIYTESLNKLTEIIKLQQQSIDQLKYLFDKFETQLKFFFELITKK